MALNDIKYMMIAVIMGIVIISGGVFILGQFFNADATLDADNSIGHFNKTLDKSAEVALSVGGIQNSLNNNVTSPLGWVDVVFGSAYNGIIAVKGSMSFLSVATVEAGNLFGIPPFMTGLISLIVIIIIAFAIWTAVTRSP